MGQRIPLAFLRFGQCLYSDRAFSSKPALEHCASASLCRLRHQGRLVRQYSDTPEFLSDLIKVAQYKEGDDVQTRR